MKLSDLLNSEAPVWVSGKVYTVGQTVRDPGDWYFKYVRIANGAGATLPVNDSASWRPDGGRPIKSIQRGVFGIASGGSTASVTISAVNMAKTELRYLGDSGANGSGYPIGTTLVLTNSTTLTATSSNGFAYSHSISWELTEYY